MAEKQAFYERRDIDLANKSLWFQILSSLGKTPVLTVGDQPIFEFPVIFEYLEDTIAPALYR